MFLVTYSLINGASLVAQTVKNLPADAGNRRHEFDPWVGKDPLEKEMVTRSTLLAGKSHRQRNLTGYSPWGCRVRLSTYTFAFVEICAKEIMTNKAKMCSVTQSCLPLYDPLDCSPPGFSVHGISQARTLE